MTVVPLFDKKHSSTRDKIISILAQQPNLSTKKINNILKKQYAVHITYQAVHKTLKQMVDQGVLEFDGKHYSVSGPWIEQLERFISQIKRKPEDGTRHNRVSDMLETIELNNLHEIESLFFRFRDEYFSNIDKYPKKDRISCFHAPHMYAVFIAPNKEYKFMEKLANHDAKHYTLVKGHTLVDKWIADFYNSKNQNYLVRAGANCSSISEVWIYPDRLVEVFFSEKFWMFFDNLYKSIREIEDIHSKTIVEKLYTLKNEPVKVVIHKDPSIIRLAKEETLSQFEEKT